MVKKIPALKKYVVDNKKRSEYVISSKRFLSTIFDIFSLTHKEEEVWPDGTHHMLFTVKLCLHAKV